MSNPMTDGIRLKTDDSGERAPALGRKVTEFEGLDTFKTPPNITIIEMVSDEVTALCPITKQPDWYTVTIKYWPGEKCLESKSLKLYLHALRNNGMFVEALASKIADDIFDALKPTRIRVDMIQKARGGVSITATAEKS